MEVALINPPHTQLEIFSEFKTVAFPLGIAYLAGMLQSHGIKVSVLDFAAEGSRAQRRLESKIHSLDLVGISILTPTLKSSLQLMQWIKSRDPDLKIVVGGYHPSFFPEEMLRAGADVVIRKEGEQSLLELAMALESGRSLDGIKGLSYLDSNGRIKHNPDREFIQNLDELPFPARNLLPNQLYRGFGNLVYTGVLSSRGCPYSCIFCSGPSIMGHKLRRRSPRNVVDELWEIRNVYGIRNFLFCDDTFTLDRKNVIKICDLILEEGLDLSWGCETRVDAVDEELLAKLKRAGCKVIFYGIESGVQRILDVLRKQISLDHVKRAVIKAKKVGLQVMGSFMLGNPTEREFEIKSTLKFSRSLGLDYAEFSITTPFPGTKLYELYRDELRDVDWSDFTYGKPIIKLGELAPERLGYYLRKAYIQFYLRPSYLLRALIKNRFFIFRLMGSMLKRKLLG